MKRILTAITVLTAVVWSFAIDNNKRTDAVDSMCIANVRTADTLVGAKHNRIRAVFADVGGIVKMDIKIGKGIIADTITVVRALNDATFYPISQVVKVYPLYNGTDSTTCQVYDTNGVLRRGVGFGF